MERIVRKLIEEGKTISAMESCTGGGLANAITNIPDASKVLFGSNVTYSNDEKIMAGVPSEVIEKYTVYSQEVARRMAYHASLNLNSDYGVGITGKLNKADENNPYGDDNIVYVSVYDRGNNSFFDKKIEVEHDNRIDNKQQVIDETEELLYEILYEKKKGASK